MPPTLLALPALLALHEKLLASHSATAVLRALFGDPVEIERVADDAPLTASGCAALAVGDPAEVTHRRVMLRAGGRAVSDADLWYVPGRLWPGMADVLHTTTIPFGTVVAPMQPRRETLSFRFGAAGEAYALEHRAILRDRTGAPIALVHECYRQDAVAAPARISP
jgi:chorismate-pyruvate lyase